MAGAIVVAYKVPHEAFEVPYEERETLLHYLRILITILKYNSSQVETQM